MFLWVPAAGLAHGGLVVDSGWDHSLLTGQLCELGHAARLLSAQFPICKMGISIFLLLFPHWKLIDVRKILAFGIVSDTWKILEFFFLFKNFIFMLYMRKQRDTKEVGLLEYAVETGPRTQI